MLKSQRIQLMLVLALVQKSKSRYCGIFYFYYMIVTSVKHFASPPKKIISLVPSQTEMLFYFGLQEEVIGITKFCVHPIEWHTGKTKIGGTKNININLIKKLQPDLIIANKEENEKVQVEELARHFNVWVTDVNNLQDALLMIHDVGELTHKTKEASTLISLIKTNFSKLQATNLPKEQAVYKLKTCYLIWKNPYMTVGGNTFINDMIKHCGLQNIFEDKMRYPEIEIQQITDAGCELILLSTEPYPFKQKHVDELQKLLPGKKIILADGEMFSWYGSRLLQAPEYFKSLIQQFKI